MCSGHRVPTSAARDEGGSASKSAFTRLYRKLSPPRDAKHPDAVAPVSPCSAPATSSPTYTTDITQKVFDYFDQNGDGKISPTELQSCVRTIGGELSSAEAEEAVMSSDLDGDGALGVEDFRRLMHRESSTDMEELRQAFGMYETKPGSGCISPSSLKRMLSRLGELRSIDDCKAMIRPFDLNGDGLLSFHEFSLMMR